MRVALMALSFIFLIGCAQVYELTPQGDFNFQQGKKTLTSKKPTTQVEIHSAQDSYTANEPLLFLVLAKSQKPVIFESNQVSLEQEGRIFSPLAPDSILSSNQNFKKALQSFNIPTPPIASRGSRAHFFITPRGHILFMDSGNDDAYFREIEFSRRILSANYLKKTTLNEDEFLGGLVAFLPKDLQAGDFELKINIDGEEHSFRFQLTPIAK